MVDGVNKNDLVGLSKQLAAKLDAADGKVDGQIKKNVWDEFAKAHGGKTINNSISLENAEKSIRTYARNEVQSTAADVVGQWLNGVEQPAGQNPVNTPNGALPSKPIPQNAPAENASVVDMREHNKNVDKHNKEAEGVINANAEGRWARPSFAKITKQNLPYVLQKDPEFFEKLLKDGELKQSDVKKAVIDLYDKLTQKSALELEETSFENALNGLKEMAQKTGVQEKYSKKAINNGVDAKRMQDNKNLSKLVNYPEAKTTESTRVATAKQNADKVAGELKELYENELDNDAYINKFQGVDKDTLAYLLEKPEIQKQIKEQMNARQIKVLLNKLGCSENEIAKGNMQTLINKAAGIRANDTAAVKKEENEMAQNRARGLVGQALDILVQFANPKEGQKIDKLKGKDGVTRYNVLDSSPYKGTIYVSGKPATIIIQTSEGQKVRINGNAVSAEGVKIAGADAAKIMEYINQNIIK